MMKKGLLIGIIILLLGVGSYLIYNNFKDKNHNENQNQQVEDTKVAEVVKELIEKADSIYAGTAFSYNPSEYIEANGASSSCNRGVGCVKITNYQEIINQYFTDQAKEELEKSTEYGLIFINNEAYLIDGYADYLEISNPTISIETNNETIIVASFEETNSDCKKYGKIELKKINDEYLVNSFTINENY